MRTILMQGGIEMSWKGCLRIGVTTFALYLAIYYWGAVAGLFGLIVSAAGPLIIGAPSRSSHITANTR